MPRTSDKSELILEFVSNFIQENGYAPSVREIGAGVGLRSTASVSYHLRALQDKGLLQGGESKGRKRAIATGARVGADTEKQMFAFFERMCYTIFTTQFGGDRYAADIG